MSGSHSPRQDEPQEENLGLDLVSQVASSSRAQKPTRPKRWIFLALGIVIIVALVAVVVSLLNGGTKASKAADAPDAVTQIVQLRNGGQAALSSSESEDAIGVALSGLPALTDGQQYVVWAVHEEDGASILTSSTGEDIDAGLTPASDIIAIHITVEGAQIPAVPSDDTEASVDLPLDPAASEEAPADDQP